MAATGMLANLGEAAHRMTGTALDDHLESLEKRIVCAGMEGVTSPEKILGAQLLSSIAPVTDETALRPTSVSVAK